ncbi:MAG TPA: hypothetical protein VGM17_13865 [Rhizomicrobium sp.]|jgi:hypothetical protein
MILLGLLMVGGAMAFAAAGVIIGRGIIKGQVAAFHNEVVISLFAATGVVYAVLLGFLVVVVWESYDGAHRNLADEAATLVPLYRLTYGMEAKEGTEMRALIRQYAEAVIDDEWPTLGTSHVGSLKARRAIGGIDRVFAKIDAPTKEADQQVDTEFLRTKSKVVADRNERLLEANDTIPWVLWLGAVGGGIIVMTMSFFMYMERIGPHIVMSVMMAGLIGLLLFMMAVLSRPFSGPLALGPEHFQYALQVMDDDDRGD